MATNNASDLNRSRNTSSTIQHLTDDILRDHAKASVSEDTDPLFSSQSFAARASEHSPPNSPLRPDPLTFSPKVQSATPNPVNHDLPNRWGDYHGGALVRSPVGSVASHRSKGTMRSRNSVKAPRSTISRSSRAEPYREGRPLDSPMVTLPASPEERTSSMFSFEEAAETSFSNAHPGSDQNIGQRYYGASDTAASFGRSEAHFQETIVPNTTSAGPRRLQSNASADTMPASVFRDFDGVHLDELDEVVETDEVYEDQARDSSEMGHHFVEQEDHGVLQPDAAEAPGRLLRSNTPSKQLVDPERGDAENWYDKARMEAAAALEGETSSSQAPDAEPQEHYLSQRPTSHQPVEGPSRTHPPPRPYKEPPPPENMVYYPAPVPRNINLPKRLSVMPDLNTQTQRASQMMTSSPAEHRKSIAWQPQIYDERLGQGEQEPGSTPPERGRTHPKDASNRKKLPPQLRATMFFDQPAVEHKVKLKRGSAMLTLEHLLDESTSAPVTAFTGITDAYVPHEHGRMTSMMMTNGRSESRLSRGSRLSMVLPEGRSDGRTSRASMLSRRSKSMDRLNQVQNRSESALSMSKGGVRIARSEDGLSRLEFEPIDDDAAHAMDQTGPVRMDARNSDLLEPLHVEGEPVHEDVGEAETLEARMDQIEDADAEEQVGPPTTLLAELQMRKAKLRQRNRTAANAFPNGMHSTLLELEAVARIEKRNRQGKRTALAWEDPSGGLGQKEGEQRDENDDDVPLGMLFPEKNGLLNKIGGQRDAGQSVGLLEKRQRENNETLSARRNRILGIRPVQQLRLPEPQEEAPDEHGDETLAQRTRRLRSRKALDEAIGQRDGAHSRAISDDFASEMMSQFGGGLDKPQEKPQRIQNQNPAPVEETLGQRRRRLQAEAAVSDHQGRQLPSSTQFLYNAPIATAGPRNVSGESGNVPNSGLLHHAEARRAHSRAHILEQNTRSGLGIGLGSTLVNLPPSHTAPQIYTPTAGGAQQGWSLPTHTYAHGFGAIQAPTPRHPRGSMLWTAQEDQRTRQANMGSPRQTSGQSAAQRTYAAGAMGSQSMVEGEMSPVQRDNIDRWRQSVMM